jgi:hypothetical protein
VADERDPAIEVLARSWLASEREASRRGNAGGTEEQARLASAEFERAVTAASREELLIAWNAARNVQHAQEMGSQAWAEAREVAELLRVEYLASDEVRPP